MQNFKNINNNEVYDPKEVKEQTVKEIGVNPWAGGKRTEKNGGSLLAAGKEGCFGSNWGPSVAKEIRKDLPFHSVLLVRRFLRKTGGRTQRRKEKDLKGKKKWRENLLSVSFFSPLKQISNFEAQYLSSPSSPPKSLLPNPSKVPK